MARSWCCAAVEGGRTNRPRSRENPVPPSNSDARAAFLSAKLDALAAHLADHNAHGARQVLADMQAAGYTAELRVLTDALGGLPAPLGRAADGSTLFARPVELDPLSATAAGEAYRDRAHGGGCGSGVSTPVTEGSLLTAARQVERWLGRPSATRISRELGIGMSLAQSLANVLRDEDRRQERGRDA